MLTADQWLTQVTCVAFPCHCKQVCKSQQMGGKRSFDHRFNNTKSMLLTVKKIMTSKDQADITSCLEQRKRNAGLKGNL